MSGVPLFRCGDVAERPGDEPGVSRVCPGERFAIEEAAPFWVRQRVAALPKSRFATCWVAPTRFCPVSQELL